MNVKAYANLFGKLADTFLDLPAEALKATGVFKAIVGRDRITARKN